MTGKLALLEQTLGYSWQSRELLELALTHKSCGVRNNERLEFLGDSILNHIIAEALFSHFQNASEGELSRMRASLVRGETLAEVAREKELGSFVKLGSGEMKSGGHRRDSILADTLEAVIGSILLDADIECCRTHVLGWFSSRLQHVSPQTSGKDPKTRLQEYLQGRGKTLPTYTLVRTEGEDHCQQFTVACQLLESPLAREGSGGSLRKAEQAAALATLEEFGE
jgi:ribonuclease-3